MPWLGRDQRIRRNRRGGFELRLPPGERELVASLVGQLRQLVQVDDDPALRRLYPSAYPQDAERDEEFRSLVHDDLQARRLASLDVVETTLSAERLDEEQLLGWLGALNDLRLVLGTKLDVSEETDLDDIDPADPDDALLVAYFYLSMLQDQVLTALQA